MNKPHEMKCVKCKERDVAFTADCLVVDTSTVSSDVRVGLDIQKQYLTTESFSGDVVAAGLCPVCMKKVSRKIDRDDALPFKAMLIYILLMVVGIALFFLAVTGKLGRMANPGLIGGICLTVIGILACVIHKLLLPVLVRRRAPWKLLGKPLGGVRLDGGRFVLLVPVGEGYYKDSVEFAAVNGHLEKETRQKIAAELIETGAWKALVEAAKAE